MAISIKKALKPFSRKDTVDINCGGDWNITIRSFAAGASDSLMKIRAEQAGKGQAKTERNTKKAASISLTKNENLLYTPGTKFFTDSQEGDFDFFIENVLVGWSGLLDDESNPVPYSQETAFEIFSQGKEGLQLYDELLRCSLDASLFVANEEAAEENQKN